MIEHVIRSVDDVRQMLHWLARRRRVTITPLVRSAGLGSLALVTFARLDPEDERRGSDANLGPVLKLLAAHEHRLLARPLGGKHLVRAEPGAVEIQLRAADGGFLEVPIDKIDDVRTLGHTLKSATGLSLTALCTKAGISLGLASFTNGAVTPNDLQIRPVLAFAMAGGFELVVQPCFANKREARLADKRQLAGVDRS